jgi:hypothetical protein
MAPGILHDWKLSTCKGCLAVQTADAVGLLRSQTMMAGFFFLGSILSAASPMAASLPLVSPFFAMACGRFLCGIGVVFRSLPQYLSLKRTINTSIPSLHTTSYPQCPSQGSFNTFICVSRACPIYLQYDSLCAPLRTVLDTLAGCGSCTVLCPRYLADIAPSSIRGALASATQLFLCVGILLAYLIGVPAEFGVDRIAFLNVHLHWWQIMLLLGMVLPLCQV